MSVHRFWSSAALSSVLALTGPATARAQQVVEAVHLVVTGGANPGTYDAQGTRAGCSAGLEGPNSWGNQLSSTQGDPKAFNSLQLSVPNAKTPAGTDQFLLVVGFGPLMKRTATYQVDTRPAAAKPLGKGRVTVRDGGATGSVNFDVETADGVKLVGTIDCKKVTRAN